MSAPTFQASWRPLVWHMKASSPGIADAHCVIFANTELVGHDLEIMSDLIYNLGKFAGNINPGMLVKQPKNIADFHRFLTSNFPI